MKGIADAFALAGDGNAAAPRGEDDIVAFASFDAYAAHATDGRAYAPYCAEAVECGAPRLYVPTLHLPDKALDTLIDYALTKRAHLLVSCSQTLCEAGQIDARFGKSPVMALHEFGLLGQSTVISGVYLDKEDLALMAQEGVQLTVLPSHDAGYGNGVAPVCAALRAGVRVRIGSGDGKYNARRDILREAALLRLLVSVQLNKQNALSVRDAAAMCGSDISAVTRAAAEREIQTI